MKVAKFIKIGGEEINGCTEDGRVFREVSLDTMKRVANLLVRKDSEFPHTTTNVDMEPSTREAAFKFVQEYFALHKAFYDGEWANDWRKRYDVQCYLADVEDAWSYRDMKFSTWKGYIFLRSCRHAYVCTAVFTPDGKVFHVPFDEWENVITNSNVPTFDPFTGSRENLRYVHVDVDWLPSFGLCISREFLEEHGVTFCPDCGEALFMRYNAELMYDFETGVEALTCTHCHNDYFWCDVHHRYELNTERHRIDGLDLCEDAFAQESTFTCADCGSVHLNRYATQYVDDDGNTHVVCTNCRDRFMNGRVNWRGCTGLYEYGFKPTPLFYTANGVSRTQPNALTIGIELEYDQAHRSRQYSSDAHNAAREVMRAFEGAVYCKRDGSLDYGCECVSMPHTLEAWEAFDYDKMFDAIRTNGLRNNSTCGFHNHLNRSALGATFGKQKENIIKLAMLMDEHRNMFWEISRREDVDDFDHWAAPSPLYDEWDNYSNGDFECAWDELNDCDRYHIVNLTNRATVEIRAWASTMTKSTALGTLELVAALVEIVKHTDFDTLYSWSDEVLCENILAHAHEPKTVRFLLRKVGLI